MSDSHNDATSRGIAADGKKKSDEIQVSVDYISADDAIHQKFNATALLSEVKTWARGVFVPLPPSDKAYYLNDDKSRHRFTTEEEGQTLQQLEYKGGAHLRLNEEQASGA
jgi:hypothetical protein